VNVGDLVTLLPLEVLGGGIIVVLLVTTFWRSHGAALGLSLAVLGASLAMIPITATRADRSVSDLLVFDDYALFFLVLVVGATAGVAILSYLYLRRGERYPIDYYTVLLLAAFGSVALVGSVHFATFFIGLEILSVSLYVLIAYPRVQEHRVEAAVKYLILAGATSAALLFGMALVYAVSGRLDFGGLYDADIAGDAGETVMFVAGVTLILVGGGFKLALVPFHMWTPDVYQGAPAPVTALIATVSKAAMVALLLRFLRGGELPGGATLELLLTVVAIASMVVGNLLALLQDNVKRILGYSSIAQMGYLLVPFVAGGATAGVAVSFFLVAYVVTMLGAFAIVTLLSAPVHEAEELEDYRGLGSRRPWLAATLALMLLSLAGIPLTGGFIGKFYLVTAGAGAALWTLLIVLVLTSAVSLYYYTRIIVVMYTGRPEGVTVASPAMGDGGWTMTAVPAAERSVALVLALLALGLLWIGVYPGPLVRLIEHALSGLL
jgi:NADH-quinone oxidoreductase subunit N